MPRALLSSSWGSAEYGNILFGIQWLAHTRRAPIAVNPLARQACHLQHAVCTRRNPLKPNLALQQSCRGFVVGFCRLHQLDLHLELPGQ